LFLRLAFFSLEIKVEGFPTTDSLGRKSYSKGTVIKWDVEIGSFSLELLLESLSKELKWGPNQVPTVWFVDKRCGEDVRLVDERQMTDLFEMYKPEMIYQVIVSIFDKDVVAEHEYDTLGSLCVVPPDDVSLDMHDIHTQYAPVNHNEPRVTQGGGVSASKEADSKGPADMDADASEPNHEPEPEPDHEPDLFDNDEEYVGVNDEHIYLPEAHAQSHTHPYENA